MRTAAAASASRVSVLITKLPNLLLLEY
jgi:hypothetical protein